MPIRVLLAEDQAMIREALAALLSFEDDIEVVAQVGRGDQVLQAAKDTSVLIEESIAHARKGKVRLDEVGTSDAGSNGQRRRDRQTFRGG